MSPAHAPGETVRLAVTPSLDQLVADPTRAQDLPPEVVRDLLARVVGLQTVLLARALSLPLGANSQGEASAGADRLPDNLRCFNPRTVAELFGVTEAYVRQLCRTSRLPAKKVGKYWLIPMGVVRDFARDNGVDYSTSEPLSCSRDSRGGAARPKASGALSVSIRRAPRRSQNHGCQVGGRDAGAPRPN